MSSDYTKLNENNYNLRDLNLKRLCTFYDGPTFYIP
jgi:hypothetical protein